MSSESNAEKLVGVATLPILVLPSGMQAFYFTTQVTHAKHFFQVYAFAMQVAKTLVSRKNVIRIFQEFLQDRNTWQRNSSRMPVRKTTDVFRFFQEFLLEKQQMAAELAKNSERENTPTYDMSPEFFKNFRGKNSRWQRNSSRYPIENATGFASAIQATKESRKWKKRKENKAI